MKIVVAILLIVITNAQERGRGGSAGRGRLFRPDRFRGRLPEGAELSRWNETHGSGVNVDVSGYSLDAENSTSVLSRDYIHLYSINFSSSDTVYDFGTNPAVAAIKSGRACYLIAPPPALTYLEAKNEINRRNGTVIAASSIVNELTSALEPLPSEEVSSIFAVNKAIERVCRRTSLYRTTETPGAAASADPASQRVLTYLLLDSEAQVIVPASRSNRPRPSFGRGGGRGRGGGPVVDTTATPSETPVEPNP